MSASNDFEADVAKHIFNNDNIANLGDATGVRGSTAAGNLYIALHTADPGEGGKQNTSESVYTGPRIAVPRTTAGFTVSGTAPTQIANAAAVEFAKNTAGTETLTHFSIGYESAGATKIITSAALTTPITTTPTSNPIVRFAAGDLLATVD
jgi:hypothetical protein